MLNNLNIMDFSNVQAILGLYELLKGENDLLAKKKSILGIQFKSHVLLYVKHDHKSLF